MKNKKNNYRNQLKKLKKFNFLFLLFFTVFLLLSLVTLTYVQVNKKNSSFDSAIATTSVEISPITSSILSDFPFPRGKNVPFGWYSCGGAEGYPPRYSNIMSPDNPCVIDNYTIIFPSFGYGVRKTSQPYTTGQPLISKLKSLNRSKQHLVYLGCNWRNPDPNATGSDFYRNPLCEDSSIWEQEIKKLKDQGITENDFFAFYQTDEQHNFKAQLAMYNAVKKYYPNVPVFASLNDKTNLSYRVPKIDVLVAQSYPYAHGEKIAGTYLRLLRTIPRWHKNKNNIPIPVFMATETYGLCKVDPSNLSLDSNEKIKNRIKVSNVMGIMAGAQGIISYFMGTKYDKDCNGKCARLTPCEEAQKEFYPIYNHIWPWIIENNRKELPVTINSGLSMSKLRSLNFVYEPKNNDIGPLDYKTVVAWKLVNKLDQPLIIVASLLEPSETLEPNTITINEVPNGIYSVLGENKSIVVTKNEIRDILYPYNYRLYQFVSELRPTFTSTPSSYSLIPSTTINDFENVTIIKKSSRNKYSVTNINENINPFTDRRFITINSIPKSYIGDIMIQTPVEDRSRTETNLIEINLPYRAIVYVAFDTRALRQLPSWLSEKNGWEKTNEILYLSENNKTHTLYKKEHMAGSIILGGASLSSDYFNYYVIIKKI